MEEPNRLSFCGIKPIAEMDVKQYIEIQHEPMHEDLEGTFKRADCRVSFWSFYFFCRDTEKTKEERRDEREKRREEREENHTH